MSPLEKLYLLEIEFHRRVRTLPPGIIEAGSLHTSYALQTGYEALLHDLGTVSARDIEFLHHRWAAAADPRDTMAARESIKQILGIAS